MLNRLNRHPLAPGPHAAAPARPAGPRKPAPPIVAYEDVTVACGHVEKFGLFEDRLDRFRKERRKKLIDRPCRECRAQKRRAEEEAAKSRKAEKQQHSAARAPGKTAGDNCQRLPSKSAFAVVYDADKTQWSGTLTIGEKVFTGSAGGVFKLLRRLDQQYRESLPPCNSDERQPTGDEAQSASAAE